MFNLDFILSKRSVEKESEIVKEIKLEIYQMLSKQSAKSSHPQYCSCKNGLHPVTNTTTVKITINLHKKRRGKLACFTTRLNVG